MTDENDPADENETVDPADAIDAADPADEIDAAKYEPASEFESAIFGGSDELESAKRDSGIFRRLMSALTNAGHFIDESATPEKIRSRNEFLEMGKLAIGFLPAAFVVLLGFALSVDVPSLVAFSTLGIATNCLALCIYLYNQMDQRNGILTQIQLAIVYEDETESKFLQDTLKFEKIRKKLYYLWTAATGLIWVIIVGWYLKRLIPTTEIIASDTAANLHDFQSFYLGLKTFDYVIFLLVGLLMASSALKVKDFICRSSRFKQCLQRIPGPTSKVLEHLY